jgi:hypothetical protein
LLAKKIAIRLNSTCELIKTKLQAIQSVKR